MQDRFKFRVWHKKRKRMYEVLHFHTETLTNGGEWVTAKGFNIITQQDIHIQIEPKDGVIMQCTGLKDKNGNLIYEGDIVKFGEFYDNEWNSFDIGKVYWGGKFDYPAFELQCSTVDFDMSNGLSYIFGNSLNIEIIGNIYENKELLNEI